MASESKCQKLYFSFSFVSVPVCTDLVQVSALIRSEIMNKENPKQKCLTLISPCPAQEEKEA